jgi:hypothetical protein
MTPKTLEYYDWFEDIEPEIVKNLNLLLADRGIEPVTSPYGGYLNGTEWVGAGQGEYVNFWHAYVDLWGEGIHNDSYVNTYYPVNDDTEWNYLKDILIGNNKHKLTLLLVDAVRMMVEEHNFYDENGDCEPIVIWYSW